MNALTLRLLNAQCVRELLTPQRCIELMRHAMRLADERLSTQPVRQTLTHPQISGWLSMMPGYIASPSWLGIKVVSVFPGNFGSAYGSHQGFVLLFETEHGRPVAILDGREITAIRTAAATAVATDVLARKEARRLGIFGYGEQAEHHVKALPHVRPFDEILVWGRDFAKAQKFAERLAPTTPCPLIAVRSVESAAEADVLCLTTSAQEPYFHADLLRPGHHLNVVGSSIPTTSEIDVDTVARSRFFVDLRHSALALAGDFRRARDAGVVDDSHILGSIGDVMDGRVSGRTSADDVTLFKSLGMICEDLVSAVDLLAQAEERNLGHVIEW
jgi:ornithine cyclodeaminase